MGEDVLTFDELQRVQSQERNADTLQPLDSDFFDRARNYLEMKKGSSSSYVDTREYRNAQRKIEDIIDRRQKKIVRLAFLSVKSGVEPDNLMPNERDLFQHVKEHIADFRGTALNRVFGDGDHPPEEEPSDPEPATKPENEDDDEPETDDLATPDTEEDMDTEVDGVSDSTEDTSDENGSQDAPGDETSTESLVSTGPSTGDMDEPDDGPETDGNTGETSIFGNDDTDTAEDEPETTSTAEEPVADDADEAAPDGMARVTITEAVPAFMGVDLEAYGPFENGETALIPEKNADVLVQQGKAER